MNNQQTAADQYKAHLDSIMNLLDEIRGDVAKHTTLFDRSDRRSWSLVGDLGHVEEMLQEVSDFLNNKE